MPTHSRHSTPDQLCLARHALERAVLALHPQSQINTKANTLAARRPTSPGDRRVPAAPELAWAMAWEQHRGDLCQWQLGPLQWGSLRSRPAAPALRPALAPSESGPAGLALVYLGTIAEQPPQNSQQWDAWLARFAPAYRLVSTVPNPSLAVLWLRSDGLLAMAARAAAQWQVVPNLDLPGADMAQLVLSPPSPPPSQNDKGARGPANMTISQADSGIYHTLPIHGAVKPRPVVNDDDEDGQSFVQGRYSRQRVALGEAVFTRLQGSTIAVVGQGRVGSPLTHSLARMGCQLLLIDFDDLQLHNLDGDALPLHEGLYKAEASRRFVQALMRPGTRLDARALSIQSPVAGTLLAGADAIITCVDDNRARLWAAAWANALLKLHLDIGTAVRPEGAEADLRLIPPGCGCLACVGGFTTLPTPEELQADSPSGPFISSSNLVPADFRLQRLGSLRSWGVAMGHLGLRMLESLYAGRLRQAVFRRVAETPHGGLTTTDLPVPAPGTSCPLCASLYARGSRAVTAAALVRVVQAMQSDTAAAR